MALLYYLEAGPLIQSVRKTTILASNQMECVTAAMESQSCRASWGLAMLTSLETPLPEQEVGQNTMGILSSTFLVFQLGNLQLLSSAAPEGDPKPDNNRKLYRFQ